MIAATNRNIVNCIDQGTFRGDFLYRLQAFSINLPPLRERTDDIKPLTRYFLTTICDRSGMECKGIAPDFIEHLVSYDWPGNVRELRQTLEQVIASSAQAPTLFANHLPNHFRIRQAQAAIQLTVPVNSITNTQGEPELSMPVSWHEHKRSCEKEYVADLMRYAEGNITDACDISKLSRTRLYQLREKYNLKNPS